MRRLVRISLALVVLLVLALIAATITVVTSVRSSFPDEEGALALPGLSAPVEVRRDQWGVPQIYADTSADLFFAQGYVHAQDRFFEMDFRRHLTAGKLSEWFGADQLSTDKFLRTLGWRDTAEREYKKLAPQTKRFLQSYADGVNAYLNGRKGSDISVEYTMGLLGPDDEVAPWEPADSIAWLKAMAWDLRGNLDDEIARTLASTKVSEDRVAELYPGYPYDRNPSIVGDKKAAGEGGSAARRGPASPLDRRLPVEGLDRPEAYARQLAEVRELIDRVPSPLGDAGGADRSGLGSNSWVVAGSRTTTGKPLLANDPHLAGQIPSIWYQAGLHCRHKSEVCPYDVAGFTFSGFPGVIIGHNDRIAWGFTNLGPDVTDLYLELVDEDSYLYDGQRYSLQTRHEVIEVKGAEPVEFTVRSTPHGPLVSDADPDLAKIGDRAPAGKEAPSGGLTTAVALRWTALDTGRTADSVFQLNAAQNWKEFREAAKSFEVPAQNLIYADVDGHIGYQAPGRIPVRRGGTGEWPMPGWSSSYGWVAWVPFDKLPSVYDPPEGYIATANNAVAGKSYQFRLADHYSYGYRAREITDRLRGSEKQSVESMAGIQLDTRNGFAPTLVPYLQRLKVDPFTRQGQATLKNWDFSQGAGSAPAAYFNAVWDNLLTMTFDDELPADARPSGGDRWFEVVRRLLDDPDNKWWDDVRTKDVRETRDAILKAAMREARVDVTHKLAKDPARWRWGRLHQLSLENQTFGQSGIGPLEALFNRGPYEVGGSSDAVLATGWNASADAENVFAVTALPSMRMVVDLANFDRSRWVNLTGASGHPWSDHYDDQIPLWLDGQTTAWPFSPGAVEKAAPQRLVLRP